MLAVSRFVVAEPAAADFVERAKAAVSALRGLPGFVGARVGRSVDDPAAWVVTTEWVGVGAYRRAMSSYGAKVHAHPLLGRAQPGPASFEVVYAADAGGEPIERTSGLAPDATTAAPGERRQ